MLTTKGVRAALVSKEHRISFAGTDITMVAFDDSQDLTIKLCHHKKKVPGSEQERTFSTPRLRENFV